MKRLKLFSLFASLAMLMGCGAPSAPASSGQPSSLPAPEGTSIPTPSSEDSVSSPDEASSSEPVLLPGYFRDESSHWREYEGDETHGRIGEEPHSFGEWGPEGDGLLRTCLVCGYEQRHEHSYPEGYEHDEGHHWKADSCGHGTVSGYGAHEFRTRYFRGERALIIRQECAECGYYVERDTYDPDLLSKIDYNLNEATSWIVSFGDAFDADTLNIPGEVEGLPVERILSSPGNGCHRDIENTRKGVVYMPSSIKKWLGTFLNRGEIDLCYDGTLEDWLSMDMHDYPALRRTNLYLPDDSGEFHLLEHVTLPAGTVEVKDLTFYRISIRSVTCNPELESICFGAFLDCDLLETLSLNEGLKKFGLDAVAGTRVHSLTLPASLTSVRPAYCNYHLLSVAIPNGLAAELPSSFFADAPKLVEIKDYRGGSHPKFETSVPLLSTEQGPKDFRFVEEDGFVFARGSGQAKLVDYVGSKRHLALPASFHDGEETVEGYVLSGTFLSAFSLRAYYYRDPAIQSEDWICNYHAKDIVFVLEVPKAVSCIEAGAFTNGGITLDGIYFDMTMEELQERLEEPLFMHERIENRTFYIRGDGGAYVPFEVPKLSYEEIDAR